MSKGVIRAGHRMEIFEGYAKISKILLVYLVLFRGKQ